MTHGNSSTDSDPAFLVETPAFGEATGKPGITAHQLGLERLFVAEPDAEPRADVFFVHGLTDHPGRHFATAAKLASAGFRVTLFDLAGHGGRAEFRDKSGWVYQAYAEEESSATLREIQRRLSETPAPEFHSRQYEVLRNTRLFDHIRQLERILQFRLATSRTSAPVFLMGFSMGGLISAETALRYRQNALARLDFRGVALLSPALKPQGRPGHLLQNFLVGTAWAVRRAPFSLFRLAVKSALELNVPVDTSWGIPFMSNLEEENELYRQDPLVPKILPSAYLSSIETQMVKTFSRAGELPVDTLFLLPGTDGIASVSGARDFAGRVSNAKGPGRCTTIQFPSVGAHDLTRSSVTSQATNALLSWLEQRVRPASN